MRQILMHLHCTSKVADERQKASCEYPVCLLQRYAMQTLRFKWPNLQHICKIYNQTKDHVTLNLREPLTYEASSCHHWPKGCSILHLVVPMYQQHMNHPSKMPKRKKIIQIKFKPRTQIPFHVYRENNQEYGKDKQHGEQNMI